MITGHRQNERQREGQDFESDVSALQWRSRGKWGRGHLPRYKNNNEKTIYI